MKRINSIVLHIKILLALAVFFSANAFSNPNDKFLKLAKENYINGEYAEGDFHIARYLGHPDSNANNVLEIIEYKNPKPTSFLSGYFSDEFFRFFFSRSAYQWGSNKAKDGYIITKANDYKNYYILVLGKPYIETWSIIGNKRTGQTGHTIGMSEAKIEIGQLDKKGRIKSLCNKFTIKGPIQYFYNPKFIDTNKDEKKELILRYNITLGDSYLQQLEVFQTQNKSENFCFLTEPKIYYGRNGYAYFKDGNFFTSEEKTLKNEALLRASRQLKKIFDINHKLKKEETLTNFLRTNKIKPLEINYNYE